MKSLKRLGAEPVALILAADDILEFHAARLLLLLKVCGTANRIDGLTKMAKLDFFVRYPDFFAVAKTVIADDAIVISASDESATESMMIRHHYGPWDKRYYHVLAHLESCRLIDVTKEKNSYRLTLTSAGLQRAESLARLTSYAPVLGRMKDVKKVFGSKSGDWLKRLIYRLFDAEVGRKPMGTVITR